MKRLYIKPGIFTSKIELLPSIYWRSRIHEWELVKLDKDLNEISKEKRKAWRAYFQIGWGIFLELTIIYRLNI